MEGGGGGRKEPRHLSPCAQTPELAQIFFHLKKGKKKYNKIEATTKTPRLVRPSIEISRS